MACMAGQMRCGCTSRPVCLLCRCRCHHAPRNSAAPAAVSLVVRSSLLVPDANGPDGSTLRLSYQMRDAAGRTRVDLHGLLLRPLLSYARGVAPPPGAAASGNVLPDCDASGVGAASGVGLCEVAVDRRLFPAAGGAAASIVLSVLRG